MVPSLVRSLQAGLDEEAHTVVLEHVGPGAVQRVDISSPASLYLGILNPCCARSAGRSSPLLLRPQEREALLAKLLKQRLLKYTEGDEAGFRSHVQREVHELAKLPFGIAMLHCIGWAPAFLPKGCLMCLLLLWSRAGGAAKPCTRGGWADLAGLFQVAVYMDTAWPPPCTRCASSIECACSVVPTYPLRHERQSCRCPTPPIH